MYAECTFLIDGILQKIFNKELLSIN